MKQAILITAHKSFDHLIDIINYFSSDSFNIYIHINKKSKIEDETEKKIKTAKNVRFLSRKYKVNWGGINLLRALLDIAEYALKDMENTFFHWISGQDFPVKGISYFENDLDINKDYLEYFELPASCWEEGGSERWELYNFYDLFDGRKNLRIIRILLLIQKKLCIKRRLTGDIPKLYGGSTWWSVTRNTLQYVIEYTKKNKAVIKRLKYTFAADEIYVQTVIMNSDYSKNVINDNLRYIDWRPMKNGAHPVILEKDIYSEIKSSNKLFARKFEDSTSDELKNMLIKDQCHEL